MLLDNLWGVIGLSGSGVDIEASTSGTGDGEKVKMSSELVVKGG